MIVITNQRLKRFFKYISHKIYYLIRKNFQNDEKTCLFYCSSILGFQLTQDFVLRKLEDMPARSREGAGRRGGGGGPAPPDIFGFEVNSAT